MMCEIDDAATLNLATDLIAGYGAVVRKQRDGHYSGDTAHQQLPGPERRALR
jgi:hypothetical protein